MLHTLAMRKDKYITFRVDEKGRKEIDRLAEKKGFRDRTAFLRQLIQNSLKAFCLIFFFGLSGCATVSFLPATNFQSLSPSQSVEILFEKPQKSYIILGKITAESGDISEDGLYKKLKQKAINVGADAIIVESTRPAGTDWCGSVIHRLEGLAIKWQLRPLPPGNSSR